ncbi:predicted protein [Chaetomium globosum CBS 148.51]|uniref:Uncharacterized protein n=1 Tax=Chaetomium globosum (strain ATCC 6205 / CBS 148.51 / DSM 1962 / NBRC 6347 / NRRL 1970) TaxID=306901 RepID=Q2HH24_CHAGB|nr:uncharacterized protein CHGG_00480 [Chaetomium globosum CBS 148.51]EAQ92245.1 predicted protein [Chaetomium globosum CBS 148.51]
MALTLYIQEYAVPPWVPRLRPTLEADRGKAAEMVNKISGIVIATSSSVKKGIAGMGGLARDTLFNRTSETVTNYAVVLGTREEQNPYTAELAAIAMALEKLPASICHRHITVITRNQSALAAVGQPRQQSGQSIIRQIYDLARLHRQRGNSVNFLWIPAEIDFALGSDAKAAAQRAARTHTRLPNAPGQVYRDEAGNGKTTGDKISTSEAKGGLRIGAAPNRNGETERFFEQDWGGRVRPLCLWTSEGIGGTLSFPMREMDSSKGRHAAMHNGKTRKPLVLSGRESAIGYKALVTRYKGSPGDDQIRNGNRKAGAE